MFVKRKTGTPDLTLSKWNVKAVTENPLSSDNSIPHCNHHGKVPSQLNLRVQNNDDHLPHVQFRTFICGEVPTEKGVAGSRLTTIMIYNLLIAPLNHKPDPLNAKLVCRRHLRAAVCRIWILSIAN